MIAYAAFCELSQDQSAGTAASKGDFGFKVLTSSDPAELSKKSSAETANGRLAMMAIVGMFFQDGLTGSAWGDFGRSTRRRRCASSRVSSAFRSQWASGIRWASLRMGARRTSLAAGRRS